MPKHRVQGKSTALLLVVGACLAACASRPVGAGGGDDPEADAAPPAADAASPAADATSSDLPDPPPCEGFTSFSPPRRVATEATLVALWGEKHAMLLGRDRILRWLRYDTAVVRAVAEAVHDVRWLKPDRSVLVSAAATGRRLPIYDLSIFEPSGGVLVPLVQRVCDQAVAADGSRLAVLTDCDTAGQMGTVSLVDPATKVVRPLEGTAVHVAMAPDGRHLAYVRLGTDPRDWRGQLLVVDERGTARAVAEGVDALDLGFVSSRRLVFEQTRADGEHLMSLDPGAGGEPVDLGRLRYLLQFGAASFSPDGTWILARGPETLDPETGSTTAALHALRTDGTASHLLDPRATGSPVRAVFVGADLVVFARGLATEPAQHQLLRWRPGQGATVLSPRLVSDPWGASFVRSPAGDRLAFHEWFDAAALPATRIVTVGSDGARQEIGEGTFADPFWADTGMPHLLFTPGGTGLVYTRLERDLWRLMYTSAATGRIAEIHRWSALPARPGPLLPLSYGQIARCLFAVNDEQGTVVGALP